MRLSTKNLVDSFLIGDFWPFGVAALTTKSLLDKALSVEHKIISLVVWGRYGKSNYSAHSKIAPSFQIRDPINFG